MTSTHVLFEEDGAFKAATMLSDGGAILQVESSSGKRTKVKASAVMLRFPEPSPGELMQRAQHDAQQIDLDFLWECAPQEEFDFTGLARDYYGHTPSAVEATSLLLRLHASPVYFYRKGRGRYRAAPPDTLKAALAALQRKKEQAERVETWAAELAQGRAPQEIAAQAARLLVRPDKQSIEWRALERACALARLPAPRLLVQAGAFPDAHALHLDCFTAEYFPRGVGFAAPDGGHEAPDPSAWLDSLPLSDAEAFSIDDSTTTEIDDCLSVQTLADGRLRVGVHIAAPALAIGRDSALDRIARERMSTVYMPGDKVTMLPDGPIEAFSLEAGRTLPTLSLYADLDEAGTRVLACDSRVERIHVRANLRHDRLDELITEHSLQWDATAVDPGDDVLRNLPQAAALRALWRLTLALSDERDRVRGKPEARHRADYSFYLDLDEQGEYTVRIVQRRRDAPLDRIVAEMMILANAAWGGLLAQHRVPGIYRVQPPGSRVTLSTQAAPHQGLGVSQYAWSTSPLRRYVDLLNQRQLIAVVTGQPPAHVSGDADLFAIVSAFDARYAAYADFQQRMERYWCLRWLAQHEAPRHEAVIVRDDLVRLAHAPLYLRMPELPAAGLANGQRILVDVIEHDLIDLTVSARYVSPAALADSALDGTHEDDPGDELGDEEALAPAPLAPVSDSPPSDPLAAAQP